MNLHAHNARRTAAAFAITAAAAGLVLTGCGKNTPSAAAGSTTAAATSAASTAGGGATPSSAATSSASQSSVVIGAGGALPFPTTVGDSWTYNNTNGTTSQNKIAAATQVSSGQQITMDTAFTDNGTVTHESYEYIVQPNGEISLPTSQFAPSSAGVTFKVISGGLFWPSAAQLASGQPVHTTMTMQFTIPGSKTQTITEHITSQGQGTQSVTVPAGTYSATVVQVQESADFDGYSTTLDNKTWFASGIGPVQSELIDVTGGKTSLDNKEELVSFTKG